VPFFVVFVWACRNNYMANEADATQDEQKTQNRQWLADCAIRLICVLVLDKFADFVDDEMVAPVRETVAQVRCYTS